MTSEAREVSRDQSMVYLLVLYSNTGAEPFTEGFRQEKMWSDVLKRSQTAE